MVLQVPSSLRLCEGLSSPEGPSWGHRQIHHGLTLSTEQMPQQPWEELGIGLRSPVTQLLGPLCSFPPVLPRPLEKNGNVFEMSPQDAHLLPGPVIPHSHFGWDQVRPASS